MKVDSSNNRVGVGEASPDLHLHVSHSSANATVDDNSSSHSSIMLQNTSNSDGNYSGIWNQDSGTATNAAIIFKNVSHTTNTSSIHFLTRPSGLATQERAKITSAGHFKASSGDNSGSDTWSGDSNGHVFHINTGDQAMSVENSHDQYPYGMLIDFSDADPNNLTNWYLFCRDGDNDAKNIIFSNGDVRNVNGTYTTFSDERLKNNISKASSQWNDIKALNFKKFKLKKYGEDAPYHLGLIAQEVEKTSPHLVDESPPTEYHIEKLGFKKDEMVKGNKRLYSWSNNY